MRTREQIRAKAGYAGVVALFAFLGAVAAVGAPDRIFVKPRAGVSRLQIDGLHGRNGCRVHRRFPGIEGLEVVIIPNSAEKQKVLDTYRASPLIAYAEPDSIVRAQYLPSDPRLRDGTLWHLHNMGLNGGVTDADVDGPEAWDLQRSAGGLIVAVTDSGVRFTHQDLALNMWRNPGETAGNRIDEDGNGYINDIHGINAARGSGDPSDFLGHGTHAAGTIGAMGDNGLGCVGAAFRAQIMALKFFDTNAYGNVSDAIECIDYARAKGARIINASWGDYNDFSSTALRDAIASARDAGIIFVAAAGNEGRNLDQVNFFPANFDLDNIIVVAATTRTDELALWSNYGARNVDLAAPGMDVYGCWPTSDGAYQSFTGTSVSAPLVAGACALVWSRFPQLTYREVIQRVLATVDSLPSLAGKCVTGGRLNLRRALQENSAPVLAAIGSKTVGEGSSLTFTASASDPEGGRLRFTLDAGAPAGASISENGVFTWTPTEAQGGAAYAVTVRVTDDGFPVAADVETISITVNELNSPPVIDPVADRSTVEGTVVTFAVTARDSDVPAQTLSFSLDPGAPAGATIGANGVFSWTPSESHGGGTFRVTVRVTDNDSIPASAAQSFNITVAETNSKPSLGALPNRTAVEGMPLTFTATATDSDAPAQTLSFSLGPGAPAGASISPGGAFAWTPNELQGGGTFEITVRVADNGAPPAEDLRSFNVVVSETNSTPVLGALADVVVDEGMPVTFTASATDADVPAQTLSYSLEPGAPAGAAIAATSGSFAWTPTEAQGGTTNTVRIRVSDNGTPAGHDIKAVTIRVNEVNTAPTLGLIPNQTNRHGSTFTFRAAASDPDVPANVLAFSLAPGAPAGAALDSFSGVFTWTPTLAQAPSTNVITVRVEDNGSPVSTDSRTATLIVLGPLTVTSTRLISGNGVTITWNAIPGRQYQVQRSSAMNGVWTNLGSMITATNSSASATDGPATDTARFYRVIELN